MNRVATFVSLSALLALFVGAVGCKKQPAPAESQQTPPAAATAKPAAAEPVKKTGPTLGQAFAGAPATSVAAMLAKPEEFVGKTVALQGNVSAMCEKRRRWLAITDDKTGQHVRVFTAPAFLVPSGAVGRKAKVEGTVERLEVPAAYAKHMAKEHKLGDPAAITGKVHNDLILRATALELD
jgi:hypothetical protein